ncbi:MAG: hypothetical protein LBM93_02485 [Oscillospiraceae bacterium]|nr:hypothetical protein [Oscillospiraceae bacterium]
MVQTSKMLLEEEIKELIKSISSLSAGDEKTAGINNLVKLYNLKIEETKAEEEILKVTLAEEERVRAAKSEEELKKSQLSEQKKDRYFRLGIAVAEIIIPLGFYAVWMDRGFKFEESGTFTSTTFRGLFNRFRPTKK